MTLSTLDPVHKTDWNSHQLQIYIYQTAELQKFINHREILKTQTVSSFFFYFCVNYVKCNFMLSGYTRMNP